MSEEVITSISPHETVYLVFIKKGSQSIQPTVSSTTNLQKPRANQGGVAPESNWTRAIELSNRFCSSYKRNRRRACPGVPDTPYRLISILISRGGNPSHRAHNTHAALSRMTVLLPAFLITP